MKTKDPNNAKILQKISEHELKQYNILKTYTKKDIAPERVKIMMYGIMASVLGLTFSLKLMENSEKEADFTYSKTDNEILELKEILKDEDSHEHALLEMLDEERLNYMGSIVLGLNDALVELTGALAGFTFAIQNSRTIALMGLITGIAASFSMAASEFLSQRQEKEDSKKALKSSLYTGIAYVFTVFFLVLPFFLFNNPFVNLAVMMGTAVLIILFFNYYISVAKKLPFKRRFFEIFLISVGVGALSFGIGWIVRTFFGLEI